MYCTSVALLETGSCKARETSSRLHQSTNKMSHLAAHQYNTSTIKIALLNIYEGPFVGHGHHSL